MLMKALNQHRLFLEMLAIPAGPAFSTNYADIHRQAGYARAYARFCHVNTRHQVLYNHAAM